jgi:hypothetical protein
MVPVLKSLCPALMVSSVFLLMSFPCTCRSYVLGLTLWLVPNVANILVSVASSCPNGPRYEFGQENCHGFLQSLHESLLIIYIIYLIIYHKWGGLHKNNIYECKQSQIDINVSSFVLLCKGGPLHVSTFKRSSSGVMIIIQSEFLNCILIWIHIITICFIYGGECMYWSTYSWSSILKSICGRWRHMVWFLVTKLPEKFAASIFGDISALKMAEESSSETPNTYLSNYLVSHPPPPRTPPS